MSFEELRKTLKDDEILGVDLELNQYYKSPKGTIVKVIKKTTTGNNLEIFGITTNNIVVKIPPDMVFTVYKKFENIKKSKNKNNEIENIENSENIENIKNFEIETNIENKIDDDINNNIKDISTLEMKNSLKNTNLKIMRKEKFEKIKRFIIHNFKEYKINKASIVFKINGIKCKLNSYDLNVIAKKEIGDIIPNKKTTTYVRYNLEDLYPLIGYKE